MKNSEYFSSFFGTDMICIIYVNLIYVVEGDICERENTEVDRDSISLAAFYRQYFLKELVSRPEFSLYQIIVIIALIQNL